MGGVPPRRAWPAAPRLLGVLSEAQALPLQTPVHLRTSESFSQLTEQISVSTLDAGNTEKDTAPPPLRQGPAQPQAGPENKVSGLSGDSKRRGNQTRPRGLLGDAPSFTCHLGSAPGSLAISSPSDCWASLDPLSPVASGGPHSQAPANHSSMCPPTHPASPGLRLCSARLQLAGILWAGSTPALDIANTNMGGPPWWNWISL